MYKPDAAKVNICLKFLILAAVGVFVYSLLSINNNVLKIAEKNERNIRQHRIQVENGNSASQKQIEAAARASRARAEVGLCIFSVTPTVRTPAYVKNCYDRVEAIFGVEVTRYGDGV